MWRELPRRALNRMTHDHTEKLTSFLVWFGFWALLVGTLTCTARGRMLFCDDEIMFQTAQSIWEDGDLAIEGIPIRTGERLGRPTGSFGVDGPAGFDAEGIKYGFFGLLPSVLAQPMLALAQVTESRALPEWSHAVRRDMVVYHRPSPERRAHEDWQRLWVAWTNTWITAGTAALLTCLLIELGYARSLAMGVSLIWVFATYAWWYAGSFLSEPSSALCFVTSALLFHRYHQGKSPRALWFGALVAGLSVHAHLLNLWCLPLLAAYAALPVWRCGALPEKRQELALAFALMSIGPLLQMALQWHHFGSPFESGRRDNYGVWIVPLRSFVAFFISPGRGVLWFAPAVTTGVAAYAILSRFNAAPAETSEPRPSSADGAVSRAQATPDTTLADARRDLVALGVALLLVRAAFMSTRSDWHGGWSLGPRYLLPALPLIMIPLASALEMARTRGAATRVVLGLAIGSSVLASGLLALHSSYERMWRLMLQHGTDHYSAIANHSWSAAPWFIYWAHDREVLFPRTQANAELTNTFEVRVRSLHLDALSHGAYKLAARGHPELWRVFLGFALLAVVGAVALGLGFARGRRQRGGAAADPSAVAPGAASSGDR